MNLSIILSKDLSTNLSVYKELFSGKLE
jgi:hypothetical protein